MNALISIFLLIIILYSLKQYKKIRLNRFRDELFTLRHKLLLLTFSSKLSCDDAIYRYYENKINLQIRFAHSISFFKILIQSFYIKKKKINISETKKIEDYQLSLLNDEELKRKIIQIDEKMGDAFISYLFTTSPLIWLFVIKKILNTNSNIKDGKIDLGVKNKVNEAIDMYENVNLKYS